MKNGKYLVLLGYVNRRTGVRTEEIQKGQSLISHPDVRMLWHEDGEWYRAVFCKLRDRWDKSMDIKHYHRGGKYRGSKGRYDIRKTRPELFEGEFRPLESPYTYRAIGNYTSDIDDFYAPKMVPTVRISTWGYKPGVNVR